ncbi:MAG: hypothetical protein PVH47_08685 [Thiohalocapsa sp.]
MKISKRVLIAGGVAAALAAIPMEVANAYWGPGYGAWRHGYVHDPAYRWGTPASRSYVRDLYLHGPGYAEWRRMRRYGWRW